MNTEQLHPFLKLRRAIRQSGTQFRRNNDNSKSIFHPDRGFCYAYEIGPVEDALDEFEATLPEEFQKEKPQLTLEEEVMERGHEISQTHRSMEARDFARTVLAYLAANKTDPAKMVELRKIANKIDGGPDTISED
jgi:hypothetical protein